MASSSSSAAATSWTPACCCCCSPQLLLRLRRRPLSPTRPLRLLLRIPRAQASPEPEKEPSPSSFAGWSDEDQEAKEEEAAAAGPFGGILGAGLAGLFLLAGITFAAISLTNNPKRSSPPLPAHTNTQSSLHQEEEEHDDAQDLLPAAHDTQEDASTTHSQDPATTAQQYTPLPSHTNDAEDQMDHTVLHTTDLIPPPPAAASDAPNDDDDGTASPGPAHPVYTPAESSLAAAHDDDKLAQASEGTPILPHKSSPHSEPSLQQNHHMDDHDDDDTLTSHIMVLDSGDVVPIQDTAIDAEPHLHGKHAEQDDTDQVPASNLPYYGTADKEETLPSHQDEESHDQNGLFKAAPPAKSFSSAGIPAPSLLSAALQVPAGQIVVPAALDPTQGNALAALQLLKVIEPGARSGDLCTRREYARWLVVASNSLSRNTYSKVCPAMYIENVSELAFDDVTTEDPDFPFIQGLAEAGLISSKLSRSDMNISGNVENSHYFFSPESPLSRQDLVSWKMALDKRQLPEVDKNSLYKRSGYIDIDKIDAAAWPALAADLGAGDQSITALAFGFTRLFQPNKPVTKGQAALALSTGDYAEVVMEELARIEAEKIAEAAVNAHGALVAQVEKEINSSFERELTREREKIDTLERLAEEARIELDRLRAEREEEKNALVKGRAAVESEIEVLSKLRSEVEEQLQNVLSKKVEISFEKNRIEKLQKEIENENQAAVQLQYELEVERKALSMARAWAEDEAKKAREHARALEEARNQWERQGIKVVVERDLEDDASAGVTWANAGKEHPVDEAINRAESLLEKLKSFYAEIKVRSRGALEMVMQRVRSFISSLKERAAEARSISASKAKDLSSEAKVFGSTVADKSKRVVEDCKEGLEKFAQRFKTD
uniref:Uncharacterized protein n=1 Tax=Avena sativa TaxID=4498 RepID=A0ACD6AQ20_AVESA